MLLSVLTFFNLEIVLYKGTRSDVGKLQPEGQIQLTGISNPAHQSLVQGMVKNDVNGGRYQMCYVIFEVLGLISRY